MGDKSNDELELGPKLLLLSASKAMATFIIMDTKRLYRFFMAKHSIFDHVAKSF